MSKRSVFAWFKRGAIILGFLGIVGLVLFPFLHPFLAVTQRVKFAQILVIEGWLPEYALEEGLKEFKKGDYQKIITTGGPLAPDFRVFIGGFLHFTIPDSLSTTAVNHPLIIQAYGRPLKKIFPHFTVWVNDTVFVGEAYTQASLKNYTFQIPPKVIVVKKVHVHFDNDKMISMSQDRDLIFRSLIIGGHENKYNAGNVVYEQHFPDKTKMVPIKTTFAESAAAMLLKLGMDSSQIEPIKGPAGYKHKTFNSALALKQKLIEQKITSFNVLTLGIHARRSRLSYEKALGEDFSIGIIAIRDKSYDPSAWWEQEKTIHGLLYETARYLYIRILPVSLATRWAPD